jgi:Cleaved Adhesin Domain/Secretion system C-terminal sorting domain
MKKVFTSLMLAIAGISLATAQAPANDNCSGAIAVPIAANAAACTPTLVTTVGATQSTEANACSASWYDDDVWYSFTTPAVLTDSIIVECSFITGSAVTNIGMAVYNGCGGTGLSCFSGASRASRFPASAFAPSTTYRVRIWGAGVGAATQGTLNLCIYNAALPVGAVANTSTTNRRIFAAMGTPATKSFVLSNGGGSALSVTGVSVSGTQFTSNLTSGATIAAGGTQTVNVTYTPDDMTDDVATMTIATNGGTKTIDLKGYVHGNGVLYEGFEGGIPAAFGNIDDDADGFQFETFSLKTYTGDSCLSSASYDNGTSTALTPDNYLVLPQMTPRAGNNKFTYFVTSQDPLYPAEKYSIMVSTTDAAVASFTTVAFTEVLVDTVWQARAVDLSAYNGQNIYVAVRHHDVTDKFIIKFDDFRFPSLITATEKAALAEGTVRAFPNPTNGNFNLSWTAELTNVMIEVSDAHGKLVQTIKPINAAQTDINLTNMAAGVYMVRLSSAEGTQTTRVSVVK